MWLFCLVFKHKLYTWWLDQSGDVQHLFHAQCGFGQDTDFKAQTRTIPGTFTVTSHPFQTGASIRVGFALFKGTEKIRVTPKPLAPTLHFKHHLFRNVIFLLFTQPYTTAGLIFLLIFTSGKRGAHTTFGPHSDVLDGCSLFSSHQTLFEEWFMSRNLWKRLPHANVN